VALESQATKFVTAYSPYLLEKVSIHTYTHMQMRTCTHLQKKQKEFVTAKSLASSKVTATSSKVTATSSKVTAKTLAHAHITCVRARAREHTHTHITHTHTHNKE